MTDFFDELERQLRDAARREASVHRAPGPWWRRRRTAGLAAVAVVDIATPALARVTGVWQPDVPPPPPAKTVIGTPCTGPGGGQPPSSSTRAPADPRLTAMLDVLRRAPIAADHHHHFHHLPGLRDISRNGIRYLGTVGGHRFFLVPAGGVLAPPPARGCGEHQPSPVVRRHLRAQRRHATTTPSVSLATSGGEGGGTSPRALANHGLGVSIGGEPPIAVAGVVPNGVTAVTVTYGASSRIFPVHNNFYGFTVDVQLGQIPKRIVWHLTDGSSREIEP